MLREERVFRLEMLAQAQKVDQVAGNYEAAVAKGLRLIEERIAFRKNTAAETQASRYQDMTFRIFRNDAIQKYRAQFDVAAKYVFLAAVAYDYETQLLGDRSGAGRAFLTDIVRQRALGEVINGVPVAGRHGWPILSRASTKTSASSKASSASIIRRRKPVASLSATNSSVCAIVRMSNGAPN